LRNGRVAPLRRILPIHNVKQRAVLYLVATGLDPVVHAEIQNATSTVSVRGAAEWFAGSSPAMTA
jgi:hypothetical protein